MPAGARSPPPTLVAEEIILLSKSATSTLPSSLADSALLAPLLSPSLSVPVSAYLAALLSLLSRSPSPSLLSSLAQALPSLLLLPSSSNPDVPHPLDLLPRLLDLAAADGSARHFTDCILAVDWPKPLLLKFASVLREFPASISLSGFVDKILSEMKGIDLQDLPSLAYQLLVLSSKGPALNRRTVVRGTLGFFAGALPGPPAIVRQVEGTVLMHVNFAVKQDPALGQEVVAAVRSDARSVNHFVIAVLFSIARVRRFNETSVGALRSAVLGTRRDLRISRDCKWLPDSVKEECLETARFMEKALIKALNESNCGREHVVPSIVQFGFVLLQSTEGEEASCNGGLMSIEELGISILRTVFEVHEMARNEIIEQCKFRILSLEPRQCAVVIRLLGDLVQRYPYPMLEHVGRLKELLDYFIYMHDRTVIILVKAILPLIKFSRDLQDYIILVVRKAMFRKEETVRLAATTSVMDLILAEKKLKKDSLSSLQESSSQASCSQQADINCKVREGLFQELSGVLQRCLSQQAKVREIVYQGLMKLVVLDPLVSSCILDFLWPHFLHFYKEDAGPPLQVDNCSKLENGKVSLLEPLDCLLSCLSWILILQSHGKLDHQPEFSWPCFGLSVSQDNELERPSSSELISNALLNIRGTLRQYSTHDGLGQSHSSNEKKICYNAWILSGIIEVFINVIALEMQKAADDQKVALEKEILELIDLHGSLEKESGANKRGSSFRKGSLKMHMHHIPNKTDPVSKDSIRPSLPKFSQERSFLATSSIQLLLQTAFKLCNAGKGSNQAVSQNNSQSSSKSTFDQCLKLLSFTLKLCLHQMKSITSVGGWLSEDPLQSLIHGDVKELGLTLVQLIWLFKQSPNSEVGTKKKETKARKVGKKKEDQLHSLLLCLNELFKLSSSRENLDELIEGLVSVAVEDLDNVPGSCHEQDLQDNHHVKCIDIFLNKIVKPLYAGFLDLSLSLETEVLSELFLTVTKKLSRRQTVAHGQWAANICSNSRTENPNAAKCVVGLAIHLLSVPDDLIFAHDVSLELLKVMGSEDEVPLESSEKYAIINHSTKVAIASVLLQLVESSLVDLEWAISKLKTYIISDHEAKDHRKSNHFGEMTPGLMLEEALYARSEALVNLLSSFTIMNLKDSQADQLLKIASKIYELLARITKLRIAPKGSKQLLPGQMFQKLAETTCRKLTAPLYNFVALMQTNQQDSVRSRGIISKIKRENKCIPDLIFQIEDYEKYLIQLSKLTKVNLLRHAKRSTARDFKILETNKTDRQEDANENEPNSAVNSASSESESGDVPEKEASAESTDGGSANENSGAEREDEGLVIQRKKPKFQ